MPIDIPHTFNNFIKYLNIVSQREFNYCFNKNKFDQFFHKIEAYITIYCRRISQDEYLVTIPIKNSFQLISTIIKCIIL